MKQQDVERNRKPLNRYKRTFREQGGKLDKSTPEGIAAWGIRKVMAMNPTTAGDERLAALETWEWDTTMRIRQVEALEQIAEALEAQRLNHVESLTCGELMDGVNLDSDPRVEDLNADGATCTSFVRLAIEDLGFGLEVRNYDDGPVEAYADATAEWKFQSPADVRALASAFRTKYATLLDMAAARWEQGVRNGSIQTGEAAA